jgi:hypothetical protein
MQGWMRVVLGVVGIVGVLGASSATAHRRFARKEGVKCTECHVAPEGGGPRTLLGQYYQATQTLPADRSATTMKLVQGTVDRWLDEMLSVPPVIRWRYTPPEQWRSTASPTYTAVDDAALLRRLSLDLRGTSPNPAEVRRLLAGETNIDAFIDEFLRSKDWVSTFQLYHKDIVRPRTGDFNTSPTHTKLAKVDNALSSEQLRSEQSDGSCAPGARVSVSPWWARETTVSVCARTASTAKTATVKGSTLKCDTAAGQASGACGCGPHLVWCYVDGLRDKVVESMRNEMANLAMEIVTNDLPYGQLLTTDWTMADGWLEVHYAKLWGKLGELEDADANKPWRRLERSSEHSGVLSSPAMLNFFYNGRRWAQRTFEAFMCHDTTPDWDLLDDAIDAEGPVAVPYRDSPDLVPSASVTEGRACAACHLQLDGLARVKDRWDYFGGYFEKMPTLQRPIPQSAMFLGQQVDGLNGFGEALAGSDVFADCTVTQVWDHMVGHRFTPAETATRRQLLEQFRNGQNFRNLVRAVAKTPEYRAKENLKLMSRELYRRAMSRATDVAWKVGTKNGWDVFYDKVGGMDYRKIEYRDRRPGTGHSLVQFKGASESCNELVKRDSALDRSKREWLSMVDTVDKRPTDAELEQALEKLYLRAVARPWAQVSADDRQIMTKLFQSVSSKHGPDHGWRAVCTAMFASEDYAIY